MAEFAIDSEIERLLRGDPALGGTLTPPVSGPTAAVELTAPAAPTAAITPVSEPVQVSTPATVAPQQPAVLPQLDLVLLDPLAGWNVANGDVTVKIRESEQKRREYASIAHAARNTPELVLGAPRRFGRDALMVGGDQLLEAESMRQALISSGFKTAGDLLHDTFIGKVADAEANRRRIMSETVGGLSDRAIEYREDKREELRDRVDPEKDGLTFGEEVLLSASDSLVASTAAITGAYLTKGGANAAAALMGMYSGLMESSEQRAAETGAMKRFAGSLVNAAAEYGFERWSMGALLGKDQASKTMIRKLGEFIAREVPSELATETVQYAAEAATRNPEASFSELWHHLAVTAVATPLSGAGQVGVRYGTRPVIKAVGKLLEGVEIQGTVLPEEMQTRARDVVTAQGAYNQELELGQAIEESIRIANEMILAEEDLTPDEINDRATAAEAGLSEYHAPTRSFETTIRGTQTSVESPTSVSTFSPDTAESGSVYVIEAERTGRAAKETPGTEGNIFIDISINNAKRLATINRKGMLQAKRWVETVLNKVSPTKEGLPAFLLQTSDATERGVGAMGDLESNQGTRFTRIRLREDSFDSQGSLTRRGYNTLAHEMGHSLFEGAIRNLTEDQRSLLLDEWQAKIIANANKPLMDVVDTFFSPFRRKQVRNVLRRSENPDVTVGELVDFAAGGDLVTGTSMTVASRVNYLLGPTEYLAEQTARWAQSNEKATTEAGKIFENLAQNLQRYQKATTSVQGRPVTMESIFDLIELQPRIDLALERLDRAKTRYAEYMAELRKNPPEEQMVDRVGGLIRRAGKRATNRLDAKKAQRDLIKFNSFLRWTQGIINVFEANPSIPRFYRDVSVNFNSFKNEITVEANQVVDEWLNTLNTRENAVLEALLFEADRRSSVLKRKLTKTELAELAKDLDLQVTPQIERVAGLVWAKYQDALSRMEKALIADIQASYDMADPLQAEEARKQLVKTQKEFKQLRNRNYMPHSRFGKYWLWMKSPHDGFKFEGETYSKGKTVIASAFEHESEMVAERDRLRKATQGAVEVITEELSDEVSVFAGMPETLMERMLSKTMAASGLTDVQKEEIRRKVGELKVEVGSAQSFKRRMQKRKNVKGYSTNGMRVFSEYFWRFSNHMARLQYGAQFEEGIRLLEEHKETLTGDQRFKMSQIVNYAKRHQEYLFNPGNEMAGLRSILFHWYLGGSVKAAMINFTQVPLVLYPYLSTRYGDLDTAAEMTTAFSDVGKFWKRGKQFSAEEMEVIEEMTRRGILHESNASVLAATAGEDLLRGRLKRFTANSEINRMGTLMMQRGGRASTYMFQQVEIMNRYVTLLSSYRLARKSGRSHEDAMEEVYHAMYMTQYEYARFNRPEMMRGKKGAFFTFWQYLTNTLFFVYDDPGKWRYLLMLLMASGLSGLPFAGNIMDLLNSAGTQFNKALVRMGFKSQGDMLVQLERDTEEMLEEILDNPWMENPGEFTMYGASRALSPFDLYYSISMGRILPTEFLTQTGRNANDAIGGALRESSAAGSLVYSTIQAMNDVKDGQLFRAMERMAPTAARNLTKAYRSTVEGVERDNNGYTIYEFKPESVEDNFLIAGQALSFTPTKIAEIKRDRYAARDAIAFYQGFQATLLTAYWKAMVREDKDDQEKAIEAMQAFNKSVPWPEMKISIDTVRESMRGRVRQDQLYQQELYGQRKYNRLYRDYVGEE